MPDETGGAVPETGDAEPQAGERPAQPQAGGQSPADDHDGEETLSVAEARKLRREAQTLRNRLKTYEDQDKTAAEKASDRIAELERDNAALRTASQQASLRSETVAVASRLGFRDPGIAYRLLDPADVLYADDGSPKNVAALLAAIAKDAPYLTGNATDFGGGPRGTAPGSAAATMNDWIRGGRSRG